MIRADRLVKKFGTVTALNELSLEIRAGEFFSILGPSGCGKTTLLRLIAGLETADSGKLFNNNKEVTRDLPQARPVNTVFQSYALFPHLTVIGNVGFGLKMRGLAKSEIAERTARAMELVQIGELANRYPAQLSGGQKQRVALARALINEPKVLLLDEPLSALDARLRKQLQQELKALQRRVGMTFVFVTHDQDEALALSDRIALMNHARIEQLGTPAELYELPRTEFAARFMGGCNIFEGPIQGKELTSALGKLIVPPAASNPATFAIRPEHVVINPPPGQLNCINARVLTQSYAGAQTELLLECNSVELRALAASNELPPTSPGQNVEIALPVEFLVPQEAARTQ